MLRFMTRSSGASPLTASLSLTLWLMNWLMNAYRIQLRNVIGHNET
jgi:hypothetical protein